MLKQIKKNISINVQSAFGQKVNRRIVVFESDDWGGIRMPSVAVYNALIKKGLPVQHDHFSRLDSNASSEDLASLFSVLTKHKDGNGKHPVFTFNVTTGNPDFDKIRRHDYTRFFMEPFYETLKRSRPDALSLWKEGMDGGLMFPQFHGREHVHQQRWLDSLRSGDEKIRTAFDYEVFGLRSDVDSAEYFMAAYDYPGQEACVYQQQSLTEGLDIFEQFFGFVPKSFIPPCYISSPAVLDYLFKQGVVALQGKIIHLFPQGMDGGRRSYKRYWRKSGLNSKTGRVNLVRNCFFEPSSKPGFDWVDYCLKRMEVAFKWGKPVVIDTHRVNYIGQLVESNRTSNLNLLNKLLGEMLKKWPDIAFMHSEQLVNLYTENDG